MNKLKIWIDTDTGVDDATALICANYLEELDILGISAVAGNQTVEKTFKNARDVLSLINKEDIKVYKGANKPLKKDLVVAIHAHGENGLGDYIIPTSKAKIEERDAIDVIYEKAKDNKGELYLVAIGPLTNVALLIKKYPDIKHYLKAIAIMGGAIEEGNITPYAEYNIFTDPEAAKIVFDSGIHIYMCGLDVTRKAYLTIKELKEFEQFNNQKSSLLLGSIGPLLKLMERLNGEGICNHDLCPLLYLAKPYLFDSYNGHVSIEIKDDEHYGQTYLIKDDIINTTIINNINREEMKKIMMEIYKK